MHTRVNHRRITIGQMDIFYREAGPEGAPVVLLPHGYPCSSYEFRNLMPRLADRWRCLAPDYPGAGYSATPEEFEYSFDGYAGFLDDFVKTLGIDRFTLYLHDFGSPIGDLPDAEIHMLDGGHWLLETHLDEVVALVRDFLGRVDGRSG